MSYDMRLVTIPPECDGAVKEFNAAVDRCSEAERAARRAGAMSVSTDSNVVAANEALFAVAVPWWFYANMSGMEWLHRVMRDNGMLVGGDISPKQPPWDESWAPGSPEVEEWQEQKSRIRAFHPEGEVGIPWWKLTHGGRVTAAECEQALEVCDMADDPKPLKPGDERFWRAWLNFLRLGASTDGFFVE
jgi:hypothetical protein